MAPEPRAFWVMKDPVDFWVIGRLEPSSCHHCDQADEKEMEKEREPEPALLAIARTTLLCQNSTAKRGGICGIVA
ncbi:hypothetical protein SKAU_G00368120 [Synaphobranchus kaupii]|uniref:Uncharacterized protein n=1 Tax=Synaphobranchus kaupii TaxID=118154 RepID=A0A9Q1IFP4_SYNKA|nr:hypothetical protein SKAU_G00368120 [Synaphobranchus kaupii]